MVEKTLAGYQSHLRKLKEKCERYRKPDAVDLDMLNRIGVRLDVALQLSTQHSLYEALEFKELSMFCEYMVDWAVSGGGDDIELRGGNAERMP